MKTALISLSVIFFLSSALADTIELNNGKIMDGTFIGREGDNVKFEEDGINMSFQASDVKNISIGATAATPATDNAQVKSNTENNNPSAGPASVAAGTNMTIRLSDTLDSGKHTVGHKFSAVLEGALVADGVTIAPAGSKVYGVVSEAEKAGRVVGQAKMLITITDININGQIVPVTTSSVNALTVPTGATSGGKVVRGAAIGALADGSSGAKTGAKIGLGAAILSGGNQVVIPPGTLLDFKLTKALSNK